MNRAPLSSRSRRSISINSSVSVPFNRQQTVTKEEVDQLKEKKNELAEEKKLLKSRIARLQVQNKRGQARKPVSTRPDLLNRLTQEYNSLQAMLKQQNQDLANIKRCDIAAICYELQEEAKIVFQERNRMQDMQVQQQIELNKSKRELDDLINSKGPNTLKKQRKKMEHYESILKKYKEVNHRLTAKIQTMKTEQASRQEFNENEMAERSEEIERQIEEAKQSRLNYENMLRNSQEKHQQTLAQLRERSASK